MLRYQRQAYRRIGGAVQISDVETIGLAPPHVLGTGVGCGAAAGNAGDPRGSWPSPGMPGRANHCSRVVQPFGVADGAVGWAA